LDRPAASLRDPEVSSQECLRSRRPEADDHVRTDRRDLRVEPGPAGSRLRRAWLLMDAPLPPWLPLEVLDHVGDVDGSAIEPGLGERAVEKPPSGAHERPAAQVLLVTRLLADEHDLGRTRTLPEDRLGSSTPEPAGPTAGRSRSGTVQRGATVRRRIGPRCSRHGSESPLMGRASADGSIPLILTPRRPRAEALHG
jgi:hypothetical protein